MDCAILGAAIVAHGAGEIISEITSATVSWGGMGTIAKTIRPYPTQAEVIKKPADACSRMSLTRRVKKVFERILRSRR